MKAGCFGVNGQPPLQLSIFDPFIPSIVETAVISTFVSLGFLSIQPANFQVIWKRDDLVDLHDAEI